MLGSYEMERRGVGDSEVQVKVGPGSEIAPSRPRFWGTPATLFIENQRTKTRIIIRCMLTHAVLSVPTMAARINGTLFRILIGLCLDLSVFR
jgi:hypothetical protein